MTDALSYSPQENSKPTQHGIHGRSAVADVQTHASTKNQNLDQRGIDGFCMFCLVLADSFGLQQPNESARKRQNMRKPDRLAHTHTRRTKTRHRETQGWSAMTGALSYSPNENLPAPNLWKVRHDDTHIRAVQKSNLLACSFGPTQPNEQARMKRIMLTPNRLTHTHTYASHENVKTRPAPNSWTFHDNAHIHPTHTKLKFLAL